MQINLPKSEMCKLSNMEGFEPLISFVSEADEMSMSHADGQIF
jgi:hypothetical protein